MYALYAFSRQTDDLCDNDLPIPHRRQQLDRWRNQLHEALTGRFHHPSLPALADSVKRYDIPPRHLFEIVDGVEMDLQHCRYQTFGQLQEYCHRVASAVGLTCLHIWGYKSDEAWQPAADCGVAFQLTNILRDLKEDAARDRIYLPLEDMQRFGYQPQELLNGVVNDSFQALLRFEIARARELYQSSEQLGGYLDQDGQRMFSVMFQTYRSLLDLIDHHSAELLVRRLRLRWRTKLAIAASPWLGRPRKLTTASA